MTLSLANQRFGRLVVIEPAFSKPGRGVFWRCRCECGNEKILLGQPIHSGKLISCGCAKGRHKHSGNNKDIKPSPTYQTWKNMVARCTQPSATAYAHYKKRGITVCEGWLIFDNFLSDMGERPGGKREYTLERIDNDRGYEPNNCRWATWKEQANNRTPNDNMRNPAAKLTDEQVSKIRLDARPQRVIAAELGVCQTQISRIKRGVQRKPSPRQTTA